MKSVNSTSEVVGDGERSLCAHVVFSASEMSMLTGPSDESVSGECDRELSHLTLLLTCAEWSKKSVIIDINAILPYIRPHVINVGKA